MIVKKRCPKVQRQLVANCRNLRLKRFCSKKFLWPQMIVKKRCPEVQRQLVANCRNLRFECWWVYRACGHKIFAPICNHDWAGMQHHQRCVHRMFAVHIPRCGKSPRGPLWRKREISGAWLLSWFVEPTRGWLRPSATSGTKNGHVHTEAVFFFQAYS